MSNVHHVESAPLSRIFPARHGQPAPAQQPADAPETARTDQVDLSDSARALSSLSARNDIRVDLVARVRSEIAGGTYVTQDKVDSAIDALLSELDG